MSANKHEAGITPSLKDIKEGQYFTTPATEKSPKTSTISWALETKGAGFTPQIKEPILTDNHGNPYLNAHPA